MYCTRSCTFRQTPRLVSFRAQGETNDPDPSHWAMGTGHRANGKWLMARLTGFQVLPTLIDCTMFEQMVKVHSGLAPSNLALDVQLHLLTVTRFSENDGHYALRTSMPSGRSHSLIILRALVLDQTIQSSPLGFLKFSNSGDSAALWLALWLSLCHPANSTPRCTGDREPCHLSILSLFLSLFQFYMCSCF